MGGFLVTVPVAIASSGAALQLVGGGGDLVIDCVVDEEFREALSLKDDDKIEAQFYNRIISDIPAIGSVYSLTRSLVKLGQGDKEEAKRSLINCWINIVSTAASVGVGYGVAFASQALSASGTGLASNTFREAAKVGAEAVDDVAAAATAPKVAVVGKVLAAGKATMTQKAVAAGKAAVDAADNIISAGGTAAVDVVDDVGRAGVRLAVTKATELFGMQTFQTCTGHGCQVAISEGLKQCTKDEDFLPDQVQESFFLEYLLNFQRMCQNNSRRRKEILKYIVRCVVAGLVNAKSDGPTKDPAVCLAFKSKDPVVLQSLLAFWPELVTSKQPRAQKDFTKFKSIFSNDDKENILNKCILTMTEERIWTSHSDFPAFPQLKSDYDHFRFIPTEIPSYRPQISVDDIGKRYLTLCGGGTRGLVTLEMLAHLEKKCGKSIKDCFDVICGTSIGGLLAIFFALGKSVAECRNLCFEFKDAVFCNSNRAKSTKIFEENFLKRYFPIGIGGIMSDISGIKIMVAVTVGSVQNPQLRIYDNEGKRKDSTPIWEVARATCAAPGFFKSFIGQDGQTKLDGGIVANNPTQAMLSKIDNMDLYNATLVSIGTGKFLCREDVKIDLTPSPFGYIKAACNGNLYKLFNILLNSACQTDGQVVEQAISFCKTSQTFYYRLNPTLPEDLRLDETDNEKLVNAIWHAKAFATVNRSIFDEIAERL